MALALSTSTNCVSLTRGSAVLSNSPGLTVFMAQSRNGPVLLFDRPPATTYAQVRKQHVCGQLGGWT